MATVATLGLRGACWTHLFIPSGVYPGATLLGHGWACFHVYLPRFRFSLPPANAGRGVAFVPRCCGRLNLSRSGRGTGVARSRCLPDAQQRQHRTAPLPGHLKISFREVPVQMHFFSRASGFLFFFLNLDELRVPGITNISAVCGFASASLQCRILRTHVSISEFR